MTDPEIVLPQSSHNSVLDAAKTVFLEDYERLLVEEPEIEEKIFKVKGLMSQLLTHKKNARVKPIRRRRRSSIGGNQDDLN